MAVPPTTGPDTGARLSHSMAFGDRIGSVAPGVEGSRLGSEFVILDAEGRMLRGLNATGARIFELLDGVRSERRIAALISAEFDVEVDTAEGDVASFLARLEQLGVVVITTAADVPTETGVSP